MSPILDLVLEMRSHCQCCGTPTPPDQPAWICSFECTWCAQCGSACIQLWCPNCGGRLEQRPTRTGHPLRQAPAGGRAAVVDGLHSGPMRPVICPVCGLAHSSLRRYPRALCRGCASRKVNLAGVPVTLTNISMSGGFAAYQPGGDIDAEVTATGLVLVDSLECRAQEARFGGIVIEPWDAYDPKHPDHAPRP